MDKMELLSSILMTPATGDTIFIQNNLVLDEVNKIEDDVQNMKKSYKILVQDREEEKKM